MGILGRLDPVGPRARVRIVVSMLSLELAATVARVVLGAVLTWAGFLKLRDPRGWLRQAADMGVGRPLAMVVPWVEVVTGVSVAVGLLMPWSAAAAGVLLLAFTVVIGLRIADGSRPPCACFGARSQRPLGSLDVLRNVALLGLVVIAARVG